MIARHTVSGIDPVGNHNWKINVKLIYDKGGK